MSSVVSVFIDDFQASWSLLEIHRISAVLCEKGAPERQKCSAPVYIIAAGLLLGGWHS